MELDHHTTKDFHQPWNKFKQTLEMTDERSVIACPLTAQGFSDGRDEMIAHALVGVDFEVQPGEFVAIMGPSGSGKSILLHLLTGLEIPTEGGIKLIDRSYVQLSDKAFTLIRRRQIGVFFPFFNLLPNLTATENVALPLLIDRQSMPQSRDRARQALTWAGLLHPPDHALAHSPQCPDSCGQDATEPYRRDAWSASGPG
jgi:predicted ABC-type transport system involved in lysophospholipase L1 biosynthesis ATPase subunit